MLKFQNERIITPENFENLPEHRKQQFLRAGELAYGRPYSVGEIFKQTYEKEGRLWEVVDTETPETVRYDVWVFDSDTANVFLSGTANEAGVCMIQFGFQPTDEETPELIALSEEFQTAFDAI